MKPKTTLERWVKELVALARDLAQHEARFYSRVAAFEQDRDAWEGCGMGFDEFIGTAIGVDAGRYRAFCRAVELVGAESALDLGIDAAIAVQKMKLPAASAGPLAREVSQQLRGFKSTHGHSPSRAHAMKVVKETAKRHGLAKARPRNVSTPFQIAVGALEEIKRTGDKHSRALATEALRALERINAIRAAA